MQQRALQWFDKSRLLRHLASGAYVVEFRMLLKRVSLALLFSSVLSLSALADGQRVILVLDASGSMRGKIDGKSKMDIAKDVVGKLVSTWKPADDLGLVVYGHREKGSCTDIETVWPPKPLTPSTFMSPINALVPKGKTPMTQAVRQAAEALKYTEQKSTVILVSDGLETCGADPCAMARELEAAGVELTVHTVGFGLDDKGAIAQLKCMAEETGGVSVLADNADELETALNQAVEAAAPPPPPPPEPTPEPVITKDFIGHVYMAEGVELPPPFDQVVWVFRKALDGTPGEYQSTEYGKELKADLPTDGQMIATLTSDMTNVSVPFTHKDGEPTTLDVNLNAGIMQFHGMIDEETDLPKDGPVWVFRTAGGEYYGTTYGNEPKNMFVAGDYQLKLSMGAAEIEASFTVAPGKVGELVVTMGIGTAHVSATYSKGGEDVSDGTTFEIRKPAGISGEKKIVTTDYGNNKTFQLPAGDYLLIVKLNLAETEVPFKVVAGQEYKVQVDLDAGFIAVKSPAAKRIDVETGKPALDGTRTRLGTEYATELNYAANTGTYHVIAYGDGDAVIGEKDVTVVAGQRVEVTLP
jgi:Ca-activated chloride channel homolog